MDFKEIQELIRMVNKNNIAELTIENQDFRIKIKTALAATYSNQVPVMMQPMQQQNKYSSMPGNVNDTMRRVQDLSEDKVRYQEQLRALEDELINTKRENTTKIDSNTNIITKSENTSINNNQNIS